MNKELERELREIAMQLNSAENCPDRAIGQGILELLYGAPKDNSRRISR